MRHYLLMIAAAATLVAPVMAEKIQNRDKVDTMRPGVSIEMKETGMIPATVVNVSSGLVFLEADQDRSPFSVPMMQSIWINGREALQTELNPGARVSVALLKNKEMRVKEFAGNRAQISTYDGLITIPVALVDQFGPDYYIYTRQPGHI